MAGPIPDPGSPTLPAGLAERPLRPTDAAVVAALIRESELADLGEAVIEEADLVGEWQRPSFDLAANSVGVLDGDRMVGYAEYGGAGRGDATVHPAYRGRGIGTWLARWLQQTARARGATEVGMPVPVGSSGEALLRSLGYHQRWESWVLCLPDGASISDQPLPEGYSLISAEPRHVPAAWEVTEDAFLEWSVRERSPLADWTAGVTERPGFQPWMLRLVTDPAGIVVGVAHVVVQDDCAFVSKLAVRADQRNRGLARALLADAFARAREHGAVRKELSTDSRTGALGLYERLGMVVTSRWVNLGIGVG